MSYESDLLVWLPRLTRYARALTGDPAWADDLVQDTLERALNKPPRVDGNLCAWLLTLLRHRFIDQLRARHEIAVDDATAPWQTMAAPTGEISGLLLRDVQRALYRLPVEQREVLLLVALEELTYQEAAQVLAVPVGTVMSRLARAREQYARAAVGRAVRARRRAATGDQEDMMDESRKPSNEHDADVSAQLLSALLDGELSGAERREVLERLQANPEDAERIAHYRAQRTALQALFRCLPPRRRCSCSAARHGGAASRSGSAGWRPACCSASRCMPDGRRSARSRRSSRARTSPTRCTRSTASIRSKSAPASRSGSRHGCRRASAGRSAHRRSPSTATR